METEKLKEVLLEVLNENRSVDNKIHERHHRIMDVWIQREERRQERWEKIKVQVYGWGIIGMLGTVGTAVYHFFMKGSGHG